MIFFFLIITIKKIIFLGCQFYPIGEYLKFVRVPENLPLGAEVLSLEVHPRSHLTIMPVDKVSELSIINYQYRIM